MQVKKTFEQEFDRRQELTVLLTVISLFFVGWMAGSLVVVAYLTIDPEALLHFLRAKRWLRRRVLRNWDKWEYFFYVSVFLGVTVISVIVIEPLLFFIPESWGVHDDGEFISTRFYLAMLIGLAAAFGIDRLLSNYRKLRAENEWLNIKLQVKERIDSLKSLAPVQREQEVSCINATIAELAERPTYSREERLHRRILEEVLEEIDRSQFIEGDARNVGTCISHGPAHAKNGD